MTSCMPSGFCIDPIDPLFCNHWNRRPGGPTHNDEMVLTTYGRLSASYNLPLKRFSALWAVGSPAG
jgi:hypothetical protein